MRLLLCLWLLLNDVLFWPTKFFVRLLVLSGGLSSHDLRHDVLNAQWRLGEGRLGRSGHQGHSRVALLEELVRDQELVFHVLRWVLCLNLIVHRFLLLALELDLSYLSL